MSENLIKVENVSKKFCRSLKRSLWYGIQDIGSGLLGYQYSGDSELRQEEFWAVRDINLELKRGESLGLIGLNGAGKTTLLRMLNGLIKPDQGRIEIRGKIGALIALGAGFNPILTGRENIYVNGAVLGFSRPDVDRLMESIVDFSELEDFIDSPVQNYSSGMVVRLGFAIAAQMEPDIMLVDEVLAVGDATFQRKCFDRINEMRARGTSFIVVSHNPYQIERLCEKAAVLHRGRLSQVCDGREALTLYHDLVQKDLGSQARTSKASREGTHELYFERIFLENSSGNEVDRVESNEEVRIVATFRCVEPLDEVRFRFEICSASNTMVAMLATNGLTESVRYDGVHRVIYTMSPCQLTTGWYYINAFTLNRHVRLDSWQRAIDFEVRLKDPQARNLTGDNGIYVCQGAWEFC